MTYATVNEDPAKSIVGGLHGGREDLVYNEWNPEKATWFIHMASVVSRSPGGFLWHGELEKKKKNQKNQESGYNNANPQAL